ncbi:MAG: radical SAM protein [Elusimicrobiales bacterium]
MSVKSLHIELLHACPNACAACDHRLRGDARLPRAALAAVMRDPAFSGLRLASFSGGEPLLYPGLAKVLTDAAAAWPGAALVLLTSLYLPAKALALLRRLPPGVLRRLHIGSSLDGPEPVHDALRGRPGAYAALRRALADIKREFPGVSAGLTFTATSRNASVFYETWSEARALGVPLGVQFLVPNANTAGLELDAAARRALGEGLRRALGETPDAEPAAADLRQALSFLGGGPTTPCGAGVTFLMLAPEGEFYLCPFHKDIKAPLGAPGDLRPPAAGYRGRFCAECFLRCAR